MAKPSLKILLQDFQSVFDHFGTLCIKMFSRIFFIISGLSKICFNENSMLPKTNEILGPFEWHSCQEVPKYLKAWQ